MSQASTRQNQLDWPFAFSNFIQLVLINKSSSVTTFPFTLSWFVVRLRAPLHMTTHEGLNFLSIYMLNIQHIPYFLSLSIVKLEKSLERSIIPSRDWTKKPLQDKSRQHINHIVVFLLLDTDPVDTREWKLTQQSRKIEKKTSFLSPSVFPLEEICFFLSGGLGVIKTWWLGCLCNADDWEEKSWLATIDSVLFLWLEF